MIEFLGGLTRLILGLFLVLNNKRFAQDKFLMIRNPKIRKPFAIFLILTGIYSVFFDSTGVKPSDEDWSQSDRGYLIQNCLRDINERDSLLLKATEEYCICCTEIVMTKMPKPDYIRLIKRSKKEQMDIILQYVKSCYETLQEKRGPLK